MSEALGQYKGILRNEFGHLNSVVLPDPLQTYYRKNLHRVGLTDVAAALTTQIMVSVPIWLNAGDTVTNLTFCAGATGAGTPTNYWFALYSTAATPALLAQSADQTSTAWAANTGKTLALATPQKINFGGLYSAAIMVKATTVPSLLCALAAPVVVTGELALAQSSGSALTATAPATIATPTAQFAVPYCVAT